MTMTDTVFNIYILLLMIRRPPRSTLFPTRRSSDLPSMQSLRPPQHQASQSRSKGHVRAPRTGAGEQPRSQQRPARAPLRSEEHTSELQSRFDLVCRLLLEKKKKK